MSKVTPRKILPEEFKDQPWLSKLLSPLNDFISQSTQAFTNNITIQDNLRAEVKQLELRTTDLPLQFRCRFPERPLSLVVGYIEEVSGSPAAFAVPVWAQWAWADGVITVRLITGLTPGAKYRINFKVDYL